MKRVCTIVAFTILSAMFSVQAADNLKAFPPAEKGMVRHVLQLSKQDDESAFQIELIAGMTVQVDEANRHFFGGKIEEETIKGWGFPRYNIRKLGPMAGTLIGVDLNAPKVNRFVALGGEPYLIRYNSRLPIVVYSPEGVEIQYRVWRADPKTKVIEKG
jgi:ecotin